MIKGICWILWALWRKIQTLTARLVSWFDFPTSDHTPCIILQLKRCIFVVLLNACTLLVMSVRLMEMLYKCSVIIFYCFQLNELGMNGEKVVATKEEVRNKMYWSVRGEHICQSWNGNYIRACISTTLLRVVVCWSIERFPMIDSYH